MRVDQLSKLQQDHLKRMIQEKRENGYQYRMSSKRSEDPLFSSDQYMFEYSGMSRH